MDLNLRIVGNRCATAGQDSCMPHSPAAVKYLRDVMNYNIRKSMALYERAFFRIFRSQ